MGKIIIFCVLVVTVPRWAGAFLPIDKFTAWGVPITAIGTGITMGLGTYYIITTLQLVTMQYRSKLAKWEVHDNSMKAQGKVNRKPGPEQPKSRIWLGLFFGTLLILTTLSQTPYIVSELSGLPVQDILTSEMIRKHASLWLYGTILVLSPEIVVAAVSLATHERGALRDEGKNRGGKGGDSLGVYDLISRSLSQWLGELGRGDGSVDADNEGVGDIGGGTQKAAQLTCFCGWNATTSPRGMSSHMRTHKAEALEHETPTKAYKHFVEVYPDAYNGGEEFDSTPPDRETLERWFSDREEG